MTDAIYIDPTDRRRIATKWVVITLYALHIWASALIILAPWFDADIAAVMAGMFSTVVTGIGLTLAMLILDRAADAILAKFTSSSPVAMKETITRTVTPTAQDVTMQVQGDVNVAKDTNV